MSQRGKKIDRKMPNMQESRSQTNSIFKQMMPFEMLMSNKQ
jgi:hypothetical protein